MQDTAQKKRGSMCEHEYITLHYKRVAIETRSQPAEYNGRGWCDECGEDFDIDDIPEGTFVREDKGSIYTEWSGT